MYVICFMGLSDESEKEKVVVFSGMDEKEMFYMMFKPDNNGKLQMTDAENYKT